jgi:spoIIIJ-associated protein
MTDEFEGKTEKDAIERARMEFGLERDCFDVEILEAQRGGIFKKGYVKVMIHTDDATQGYGNDEYSSGDRSRNGERNGGRRHDNHNDRRRGGGQYADMQSDMGDEPADAEFESKLIEFISTVLAKMDCQGKVRVVRREKRKITLTIDSADSAIIIGKKGKNLDALQLLLNLFAAKIQSNDSKIILDCENYRLHHEESLVRLAYSVAAKVRNTRQSILLEPMNPHDRRLVHSAIGESGDIETNSEGEGLFKQIRVSYRGGR